MTNFHFRLQRVLDWRNIQFRLAETDYRRADAKLQAVRAQQAALASRKQDTRLASVKRTQTIGHDLAPLTAWYQWTESERTRLARLEAEAQRELQQRRQTLLEAQRKVRLLEKLREGRQSEWQIDFDCEIAEIVADSTASRYARDMRR